MIPSISIDSIGIGVPVQWPARGRKPAEAEVIHIEVHDTECHLWSAGDNLCRAIFKFDPVEAHPNALISQPLGQMPHLDEVFRVATDYQVANRSNLVGAHLEPAVRAMEEAIAARDGSSVYFADAGGQIKIGWSKRVAARIGQLQTGSAIPIKLLGTLPGGRPRERQLHERFAHLRASGEWFVATPELLDFVAQEVIAEAMARRAAAREAKRTKESS